MALPQVMIGAPVSAAGAFAAAPVGSTLPVDATSELDKAFKTRGLIGEDGFKIAQDRSTTDIKAWGGSTVRTLTNEFAETITVTFLESANAEVLKAVFGEENVTVGTKGEISVAHSAQGSGLMVWAATMRDGTARRRIVAPKAELFLNGEISYVHSDAIKYEVNIKCYPDDKDKTIYEYLSEAAATPAPAAGGGTTPVAPKPPAPAAGGGA